MRLRILHSNQMSIFVNEKTEICQQDVIALLNGSTQIFKYI